MDAKDIRLSCEKPLLEQENNQWQLETPANTDILTLQHFDSLKELRISCRKLSLTNIWEQLNPETLREHLPKHRTITTGEYYILYAGKVIGFNLESKGWFMILILFSHL